MTFNGSKDRLVASLKLIPSVLAGKHPDRLNLCPQFWGCVGNAVLRSALGDYLTKMFGGTGLDGVKWAPLAAATLAKRRRAGRGDDDILVETLTLIGSLQPGPGDLPSGAPGQVFEPRPGGVAVGSDLPYADFHQNGVPPHLPARPFLPADLPAGWEAAVERGMEEGLVRVIEEVVAAGGID